PTPYVVPAAELQPLSVTVTQYMPPPAVVASHFPYTTLFRSKPFGPVHEYVAPATVGVESEMVAPSQYGPPLDAVGVAGTGLTTTFVLPAAEVQPLTVTVTEEMPASGVEAVGRGGL